MDLKLLVLPLLIFSGEWGFAQSVSIFDVTPVRSAGLQNVVIDSQITDLAGANYTRINMHLGCFATNLRSVANPVSEFSMITALIDVYDSGGVLQTYQINFPAEFLKHPAERFYSQAQMDLLIQVITPATGAYVKAFDNTIQFIVPHLQTVAVSSSGEVSNLATKNLTISSIRFLQGPMSYADEVALSPVFTAATLAFPSKYTTGQYIGYTGPLSGRVNWYVSNDTGSVDVTADFPGAARSGQRWGVQYHEGFCGGYYSPLVLFFDDEFPDFTASSSFQLIENQTNQIHWPEIGSKAYFLVLDKNRNGVVDDGSELFGDRDGFENGFKNLASYDLNKNGVIDKKDPIFSKLKLWYDKNADGITQKGELKTLAEMGVESIQLNYIQETKMFGERAEYREKSTFGFRKSGKKAKGKIIDIWLSAAGKK